MRRTPWFVRALHFISSLVGHDWILRPEVNRDGLIEIDGQGYIRFEFGDWLNKANGDVITRNRTVADQDGQR